MHVIPFDVNSISLLLRFSIRSCSIILLNLLFYAFHVLSVFFFPFPPLVKYIFSFFALHTPPKILHVCVLCFSFDTMQVNELWNWVQTPGCWWQLRKDEKRRSIVVYQVMLKTRERGREKKAQKYKWVAVSQSFARLSWALFAIIPAFFSSLSLRGLWT